MPSSTEVYTSLLLVSVDGTALAPAVAGLLERSRVTDAANLPDSFELEFVDPPASCSSRAASRSGQPVTLAVSQNGPGGPQKLLEAEVTALDREDVGGELRTRVRGLDTSHRLFRGRRVAAYVDMSTPTSCEKVAQRAGVKVSSISGPPTVMAHTTQDNVSDWVFLKRLADDAGCVFSVIDKQARSSVRRRRRPRARIGLGERGRTTRRDRARPQHAVPARDGDERRAGVGGRGARLGRRGEAEGGVACTGEDARRRSCPTTDPAKVADGVLEPDLRQRRRRRRAAAAGQARPGDRRPDRRRVRRDRGADHRQPAHPIGCRGAPPGVRRAVRRPLHRHRVAARVQRRSRDTPRRSPSATPPTAHCSASAPGRSSPRPAADARRGERPRERHLGRKREAEEPAACGSRSRSSRTTT